MYGSQLKSYSYSTTTNPIPNRPQLNGIREIGEVCGDEPFSEIPTCSFVFQRLLNYFFLLWV